MKLTKSVNLVNRRNFIRSMGIAGSGLSVLPLTVCGFRLTNPDQKHNILFNPTPHSFYNEPVRLKAPPPGPAGTFMVKQGDREIPYQVEEEEGEKHIWIGADLPSGSQQDFSVTKGIPVRFRKRVTLYKEADFFILENRKVSLKIPAQSKNTIPGPIAGIKMGNCNNSTRCYTQNK